MTVPELASTTEPLGPGLPSFHRSLPSSDSAPSGTIIASEAFDFDGVPGRAWRVAYTSRSIDDQPIVVTGLVILPAGTAPPGGWPILSWAHGTTGIGDICAPSADTSRMTPARGVTAAGYAFVATDYEGLGTLGRHPYLVGESEARSTLDIALAASRVPEWNTGRNVAVWGHSQGGHAALFTPSIATQYLPEINVAAVVAGAPPSGLDDFALDDESAALRPFSILVALAFNGIDPERAPLEAALSPVGVELALQSTQSCNVDVHAAVNALPPNSRVTKTTPTEEWRELLRANDPQFIDSPSSVPTLIIHGTEDELIPLEKSLTVHRRFCELGRPTELWIGDGRDHSTIVSATFSKMMQWISSNITLSGDRDVEPGPGVSRTLC